MEHHDLRRGGMDEKYLQVSGQHGIVSQCAPAELPIAMAGMLVRVLATQYLLKPRSSRSPTWYLCSRFHPLPPRYAPCYHFLLTRAFHSHSRSHRPQAQPALRILHHSPPRPPPHHPATHPPTPSQGLRTLSHRLSPTVSDKYCRWAVYSHPDLIWSSAANSNPSSETRVPKPASSLAEGRR